MPYTVELAYTGDFWIDQGTITLWNLLTSGQRTSLRAQGYVTKIAKGDLYKSNKKEVGLVTLTSDKLILQFKTEMKLNSEVSKLIKKVKSKYLRKASTGRMWWSGLPKFFFSHLTTCIDSFFSTPIEMVTSKKSKWVRSTCDFCGAADRRVKVAGATEHPLVVITGKFSSFYSHLKGDIKICSWCTFASKFAPQAIFYSLNYNVLVAMCLESNNFLSLVKVLKEFSRFFAEDKGYRNFPHVLHATQFALETFLDFLFATKQEIEKKRSETGRDMIEKGLISRVHVLRALSTRALMIDRYYVIPNLPSIFHFVTTCDWKGKGGKKHNALVTTADMLAEKRGTEYDTTLREDLARLLIHRQDVSRVIELYLLKNIQNINQKFALFRVINTRTFIKKYMLNQLHMDSRMLAVAKSIGEIIGDTTHGEGGNKSLLYSLRSIGNLNSLLEYLKEFFIRYIEEIKPDKRNVENLLNEINNSNWETYKSLIGIYAALRYTELQGKIASAITQRG